VAGAGTAPNRSHLEQIHTVRSALAAEFDAALGLTDSLHYTLGDPYQAVRDVVGSGTSTPHRCDAQVEITVRFVLDGKGRPQWSKQENGYRLQGSLHGDSERTASVVGAPPTIRPARETVNGRPEFRNDFVAYGDFVLKAELRTRKRAALGTVQVGLTDALRREYPEPAEAYPEAVADIERH
jgi:hypothetical protein